MSGNICNPTHRSCVQSDRPVFWLLLDVFKLPSRRRPAEASPQVPAELAPNLLALLLPELDVGLLAFKSNSLNDLLGLFRVGRDGVSLSGQSELNGRLLDPPGELENRVVGEVIWLLHSRVSGAEQQTARGDC